MKIKIKLLDSQKIKWEGITDFGELYKYMKLWLEDNNYLKDEKTLERKYIERAKGDKKQLEISWHAEKKKSDFFVYNIDTLFLILGMEDVEIDDNGVKRKMQKAIFEMQISSYLESTKAWDELKGLQKIYYEMIIRKRINDYLKELYDKSMGYFSYTKKFLGLRD